MSSLNQSLSQQQTLAPQMRQSLEILQATSLELEQIIAQSIQLNPTLEDRTERDSYDELIENEKIDPDETDSWQENYADDLRELRILEKKTMGQNHDAEEQREHFFQSQTAPLTLQSHLSQELIAAAPGSPLHEDTLMLIGNLDERGYHDIPLIDLATQLAIPLTRLEDANSLLQSFDPAGIGASDLRDCLLLQLERRGQTLSLAAQIVSEHLDDLARNNHPKIVKSLHTSLEAVDQAASIISRLDPAPGTIFDGGRNPHIRADVVIEKNDYQEWEVSLTGNYLPKIRLNDHYKDLMSEIKTDKKTRTYLRDHLREGRHLIKALDQRQETILAISREITARQIPFLEKGRKHLKPLTMNDIAEAIGVHPTTISRAVSGKYARTPWGLYELRKFFAAGLMTEKGNDISNNSVKEDIQEIISNENQQKPLSDQKIAKLLHEQRGLKIARRTIGKYRDQLGILPTHLRKKH